MLGIKGSN